MEKLKNVKELEKIVKDRLTWNNEIDESQISIFINDDIATLKGCVSTYLEKILAEIETQMVPGIKSVINNIEVKFLSSYVALSDQEVKDAMFCLLDANSELHSNDVKVSTNKGRVLLEGIVNSYWKRDKIQKLASQISGVVSVTNKIKIIPDEVITDEEITKNIVTSMRNSVHFDAKKVDLSVRKGIVTLSGTLSSMSEYKAVINNVRDTKGVIEIINNLKWILQYETT